jgi:hypothetical protein
MKKEKEVEAIQNKILDFYNDENLSPAETVKILENIVEFVDDLIVSLTEDDLEEDES